MSSLSTLPPCGLKVCEFIKMRREHTYWVEKDGTWVFDKKTPQEYIDTCVFLYGIDAVRR
jgi:hypothetical protein